MKHGKVLSLLKGFEVRRLSGIEPNPRFEGVYAGAKICREQKIDVILAVGGVVLPVRTLGEQTIP